MNCPNCGASMRLGEADDRFSCDYCGTIHFPAPNADGVRILEENAGPPCPVCGAPLADSAIEGQRLRSCVRCRGVLIPMDRFGVLVAGLRARRAAGELPARPLNPADLERRIHCPGCGEPMHTHAYAGPGNVVIDNCPQCRLNWLDHAELQRIAGAPDPSSSPEAWLAIH